MDRNTLGSVELVLVSQATACIAVKYVGLCTLRCLLQSNEVRLCWICDEDVEVVRGGKQEDSGQEVEVGDDIEE